MKKLLLLGLLVLNLVANAQQTFPVNGPRDITPRFYAFTNATLFVDYQTKIEQGLLLIKDGKVLYAGVAKTIPQGASVVNLKGKFIYPAFIDLYASYGIQPPSETKKTDQETRQFVSAKKGAYNWNEAIRAEVHAANYFATDDKKAAQLREAGFGVVLSGLQDGICRGSSALVLTAAGPEQEMVLVPKAATGFSFNKGSSRQSYPSSLMGSIALLRQTYYDAQWYQKQNKETNLTLESFNQLKTLPAIFEVNNKLAILRADKVGDEFGVQYVIKTAGDEYQRLEEVKATNATLVVPVNFPKPYDVEDPFDAAYVSTTDLKHWEMAPFNARLVNEKGIRFTLTYDGCENAKQFLQNVKKAVESGLPEADALKALTATPAAILKQEQQIGSLKAGMMANFLITDAPVFTKDAILLQTWVKGKQYVITPGKTPVLAGKYAITHPQLGRYALHAKKGNQQLIATDTLKVQVTYERGLFEFQVTLNNKGDSIIRAIAWPEQIDSSVYPAVVKKLSGNLTTADGKMGLFTVIFTDTISEKPAKDSAKINLFVQSIVYPFTDFGNVTLPKQETYLFKNATIWTNEKEGIIKRGDVLVKQGKIASVGSNLSAPEAIVVDATDKHITSGIIDEHSHIAISSGVNEGTQSSSSEVRVGDVVNSEDINIYRQLAGGVVASQLLHGSANPIGGQSALIKLRWGFTPEKMKMSGADGFIKFALGENVKQANWGERAMFRYPQTRMGVEQTFYDAFIRAKEYEQQLQADATTRKDLELDALVEILRKKRFITCHSYVQSEINMLMHVADSMGFKVNTFTHILEGYKVADKMKAHGVNASTFADWWAYKYEVMEAIPYNAAILAQMGVNTGINSDDAEMGRRLNQEAAKVVKYGGVSEEEALKMVTLNPAKMLHLDATMGSIKVGKDADLVLWNNHPLSIYAKVEMTLVDGMCMYSIEKDNVLREELKRERERIIQKMMVAKRSGEKTEKKVSKPQEEYHCND
ncbi:MAG: amidohydrolase family protein [Bacteroidota bacterium]